MVCVSAPTLSPSTVNRSLASRTRTGGRTPDVQPAAAMRPRAPLLLNVPGAVDGLPVAAARSRAGGAQRQLGPAGIPREGRALIPYGAVVLVGAGARMLRMVAGAGERAECQTVRQVCATGLRAPTVNLMRQTCCFAPQRVHVACANRPSAAILAPHFYAVWFVPDARCPCRSGHSLVVVGRKAIVFGGCCEGNDGPGSVSPCAFVPAGTRRGG